jgi:hypothetical protein
MEGIILIILFAVIANIIRAASVQKGTQGRSGRPPAEIFRELRERDSGTYQTTQSDIETTAGTGSHRVDSPGMAVTDSRSIRKQRGQYESGGYTPSDLSSYATAAPDGFAKAPGLDVVSKPMQSTAKSRSVKHRISFSRNSMLNGIILSEVLGPPKGRRK